MKKGLSLIGILVLMSVFASADSIWTDQINFAPGSTRTLSQIVQLDAAGDLAVELDPRFNLTWSSPVATVGQNLTWSSVASVVFNLSSPANCTEGDTYTMPVYINDVYFDSFIFVCTPDNKVVDYKAEYGHGDMNYLDDTYRYLPANSSISLFNLIRVYTYGSYTNPDEDALNATITCAFPNYLVLTRQSNDGTDIVHTNTGITATFYWTSLFGNWFRVAPLEQEIKNTAVGDTYNITCGDMTYQYTTGQVRAPFAPVSFEFRSKSPLNITAANGTNDNVVFTIQNIEKYPVYDVEFLWTSGSSTYTETITELRPNETISYELFLEGTGILNLDTSFIPVWLKNSIKSRDRLSQEATMAYSFGSGSGKIISAAQAANTPRVTITHFPELLASNDYKTRVIFEVDGIPTNADSLPSIVLKRPNESVYVAGTMTNVGTGVYEYSYAIIDPDNFGIWLTEVNVTWHGKIIPRYDYWDMKSNPTKLEIVASSICGDQVCASIEITNEGNGPYEYVYFWWVTDDPNGAYSDNATTDRGTASKLIGGRETYTVTRCLTVPDTSQTHYFKAMTYFGEYAYATDSFTNGLACRDGSTGAGGRGPREGEETISKLEAIEIEPGWFAFFITMAVLIFLWIRTRKYKREHFMRYPTTQEGDPKKLSFWDRYINPFDNRFNVWKKEEQRK